MTTDFTYGNKAITTSGPTKPATVDSPNDLRTRVKTFADIRVIPMPYVGMIVTVLADETNNGKMTDYKVLSLKANNLGIPNTVINEVERYVDYLGVSAGGGTSGNNTINYITSPDGSKFKIVVSNEGVLSTEKISSNPELPDNPDNPELPTTAAQIVDFYGGNLWEACNFVFKEGYTYELTPVSDCSFNNLTEVTTIDATSGDANREIKGHYKIKASLDGNETNPPVNFVRSTASILYPLVTKISGLKDIVFIGDSLTDASFSVRYGNYVKYLFDKHNKKYNFVTQLATFGHTSDQQVSVINKYLTMFNGSNNGYFDITPGNGNAKIVSVFTGTNEINQDIDISTFETNYTNIINKVKENFTNARIICITPYLCCKKSTNINYINKIKEIAASNECILCDLSTFTELDSVANGQNAYYLEQECIHLTPEGWNLVNPTIEAAFNSAGILSNLLESQEE